MTRLELLHAIQDNAEQLTLHDAFALLASRLPVADGAVSDAWEELSLALRAKAGIGY